MHEKTRRALNAMNRAFYVARGADFDASRDHPWPGWQRALASTARPLAGRAPGAAPRRVLDLGCGNGRFGVWLMHLDATPTHYLGLDASPTLLDRARAAFATSRPGFDVELRELDFVEGDGPEALPLGPFDLVVVFGVLHHVPGAALRRRLVESAAARLAPGGGLVVTAWQFGGRERFERSLLPEDVVEALAPSWGVDPGELEPGDRFLGFGGDSSIPRYCHAMDAAELDALMQGLGVDVVDAFAADGKSADLNLYRVGVKRE